MSKIIGYTIKEGEFKGKPYKNATLYLASEITKNGSGFKVENVSLRYSLLEEFSKENEISVDCVIGEAVEVLYNQYGKVAKIYRKETC